MRMHLNSGDVPVKILICDDMAMQLFWGVIGDPSTYKAGPAHGKLSNCKAFDIDSRVAEIRLWKANGAADSTYSGLEIDLEVAPATPIVWGAATSTDANMPETISASSGDAQQFFGFETKCDTDANGANTSPLEVSVVAYEVSTYNSNLNIYNTYEARINAEDLKIDTADDGLAEWQNIAFYEKVIESDLVTNKPKPTPKDINVVRPEQVAVRQAEIAQQIAEIEAEKALTAKHAANAKAIADAQAASDADAVKNAFKGYHDGKVAALEASHRASMSDQRTYYRSSIITLLGLDSEEANDCDDECLELVGIKQVALTYEEHENEDENTNAGALVAVIIGGIVLIVLLVCLMMRMQKNKQEAGSMALNTNSYRSDNNV